MKILKKSFQYEYILDFLNVYCSSIDRRKGQVDNRWFLIDTSKLFLSNRIFIHFFFKFEFKRNLRKKGKTSRRKEGKRV